MATIDIFNLSPRDFNLQMQEEAMYRTPAELDELRREYRNRNSMAGKLMGLLAPEEGKRRSTFLPVDAPQGMSIFDALRSGQATPAVPQGLVDLITGGTRGVESAREYAQGVPPRADALNDALTMAGLAMTGGGAVGVPRGAVGANALRVYHGGPKKISPEDVEMRFDPEGTPIGFSVTADPDVAQYYRNMRGGGSISEFDIDLDKANIISETDLYRFIDGLESKLDADASYEQIQRGLLDAGVDAIEYPDPEFGIRVVNPSILAANASKSTGLLVVEQQARGNKKLGDLFESQNVDISTATTPQIENVLDMAQRRGILDPRSAFNLKRGLLD